MSNRIEHIDSVKGFAIFVVVVGHVIANFFDSWSNTLSETPVALYWWRLIYTFHMPLMMFMSGFLFLSSRVQKDSAIKVWWHKSQPLVIPFFTMGVIIYLLKNQKDSYWYLRTLFEFVTIQLIYEIVRKLLRLGWKSDIAFLLLSWLGISKIFNYAIAVPYFDAIVDVSHLQWLWFYFCSGVIFRRYDVCARLQCLQHIESYLLLVFAVYIFLTIGLNGGGVLKIIYLQQLVVLSGLASIYIGFAKYSQSTHVMKAFQYMGRHTLEIYLLHVLLLLRIGSIGDYIIELCNKSAQTGVLQYQLTGLTIEIALSVFVSLLIIILCAGIYEPLKAFPLVYRLFFGRKV